MIKSALIFNKENFLIFLIHTSFSNSTILREVCRRDCGERSCFDRILIIIQLITGDVKIVRGKNISEIISEELLGINNFLTDDIL